jgi:hypothetical protein
MPDRATIRRVVLSEGDDRGGSASRPVAIAVGLPCRVGHRSEASAQAGGAPLPVGVVPVALPALADVAIDDELDVLTHEGEALWLTVLGVLAPTSYETRRMVHCTHRGSSR